MKKLKLIIREISNYFFILSSVKKEERNKSSLWYRYNLRRNWYGRIYTVLSLREEDMGDEAVVRNWKAMERMRPINDYLESLQFQEIIYPSIEEIPDSRSYLIVYSPIFDFFTFKWVLSTLFKIVLIISLFGWISLKLFSH